MNVIVFILSFIASMLTEATDSPTNNTVSNAIEKLKNYDHVSETRAMVLGTFHFTDDVLSEQKQSEIKQLVQTLKQYQPTKIVVEWQPKHSEQTNLDYQNYLNKKFSLGDKANEVYQIGFKLAESLGHQKIYLFDDQTAYEGVLAKFKDPKDKQFSFDKFISYAKKHDPDFYNKHEENLTQTFKQNNEILNKLSLHERFAVINAPIFQHINAQRMHMFEIRVGIQKNWLGPDWLGRWYRRNIRMMANLIQMAEKGDRLLIIVGDNHKWLLDELIDKTPDIKLDSSWKLLKNME